MLSCVRLVASECVGLIKAYSLVTRKPRTGKVGSSSARRRSVTLRASHPHQRRVPATAREGVAGGVAEFERVQLAHHRHAGPSLRFHGRAADAVSLIEQQRTFLQVRLHHVDQPGVAQPSLVLVDGVAKRPEAAKQGRRTLSLEAHVRVAADGIAG